MVTTRERIAKIWREKFWDWKNLAIYDLVAPYQNAAYEDKVQAAPAVIAALAELKKYRDVEGVAAKFPQVTKRELSNIAFEAIRVFERQPMPARKVWHALLWFLLATALAVPIFVSKLINDEVYFISKISTAVVTVYLFVPYVLGSFLSLGMYWKFAETRLIHPLPPLFFVILAFVPHVHQASGELWYKAMSGFLALMVLILFIFLSSLRRKRVISKIAKDAERAARPIDEETVFDTQRLVSKSCFETALEAMLKLEKSDDKIKIGHTKRDQASLRKETLSIMIAGLDQFGLFATGEKQKLWTRFKTWAGATLSSFHRILAINDEHWDTYHHPLGKCPVLFMEIGFMAGQLIIYRGYLATFIDTIATQTRVILKLGKIVFDEKEPPEAALAEFARLVAGAFVGFLLLGIPYAVRGEAWVEGANQIYLSIGLTAAKLLLSNHVAPTINIFALAIVFAFEKLFKFIKRRFQVRHGGRGREFNAGQVD